MCALSVRVACVAGYLLYFGGVLAGVLFFPLFFFALLVAGYFKGGFFAGVLLFIFSDFFFERPSPVCACGACCGLLKSQERFGGSALFAAYCSD